MALTKKMRGTRGETYRLTVYIPVKLAERLDKVWERQFGPGGPPFGIATTLVTRLIDEYVATAEGRLKSEEAD